MELYPPRQASKEENVLTCLLNNDLLRKNILLAIGQLEQTHTISQPLYASAGFIRNLYWDHAHQHSQSTPLNDVDVVYFDTRNIEKAQEKLIETQLNKILPGVPWSVKNQARMHYKSGHVPYTSLENALSNWVETATAIGVRVNNDYTLSFVAPWGLRDLFDLILRPTPYFISRQEILLDRVKQKRWQERWGKLTMVLPGLE